jgi:hypothetical protein
LTFNIHKKDLQDGRTELMTIQHENVASLTPNI